MSIHKRQSSVIPANAGIQYIVDIGTDPLAFDQQQMRAGFDAGYRLAKEPEPWSDVPPLIGDLPEWMLEVVREKL
jgi:hypothetical protein